MPKEICTIIKEETKSFLSEHERPGVSKKILYHTIVDLHPEYLDSATPKAIKRYITLALRENNYWEVSKRMNWFVKGGL